MKPHFQSIEKLPDDPILSLPRLYAEDLRAQKVNLGIGSYQTEEGHSVLFKSVALAEERLCEKKGAKDYLPIEGAAFFIQKMIALNLGCSADPKNFGVQTIGGTGALRLAADISALFYSKEIAISQPSWPNHQALFQRAGFNVHFYPYFDAKSHQVLFKEALSALKKLPDKSLVLFQPSCHNPTGADFSKEEWKILLELVQERNFFPLFDNSYQGFGTSLDEDAYPIRLFFENRVELMIAMGCSKNFGLYGERVGALIFALQETQEKEALMSQIRRIIRTNYSSPPLHGVKIIEEIFKDANLEALWKEELNEMRERIKSIRNEFANKLVAKTNQSKFHCFEHEKGFFSLLGISEEKVMRLREEKGIYLLANSRINIAGLNAQNLEYVVDALVEVGI